MYSHDTISQETLSGSDVGGGSYVGSPIDNANFRMSLIYDQGSGAPWDNSDCFLGSVTGWQTRSKAPGELILNEDRGSKRFYDFAGAVRKARAEGLTGEHAAENAQREFNYFRDWCENKWCYVGVVLEMLDDEGEPIPGAESALWGIESDATDYIKNEVVRDLARDIENALSEIAGKMRTTASKLSASAAI